MDSSGTSGVTTKLSGVVAETLKEKEVFISAVGLVQSFIKFELEFLGLTRQKLELKAAPIGFKLWIPS